MLLILDLGIKTVVEINDDFVSGIQGVTTFFLFFFFFLKRRKGQSQGLSFKMCLEGTEMCVFGWFLIFFSPLPSSESPVKMIVSMRESHGFSSLLFQPDHWAVDWKE